MAIGAVDQRLRKLIVSPELGERADLERLARDLMARMEPDLGLQLDWVAVAHHNTRASPRSHRAAGRLRRWPRFLRLNRDYIKTWYPERGGRFLHAPAWTPNSSLDAAEAERREIAEKRFTSLDRAILREAGVADDGNSIWMKTGNTALRERMGDPARLRQQHLAARLPVLKNMGLAQEIAPGQWAVRRDCERGPRYAARRLTARKCWPGMVSWMSDERLPIELLNLAPTRLNGR